MSLSRNWFRLGAAAVAAVVLGCGEDNPAPKTDMSSPNAGLNALEQMNKGAGGAKGAVDAAKSVDTGKKSATRK